MYEKLKFVVNVKHKIGDGIARRKENFAAGVARRNILIGYHNYQEEKILMGSRPQEITKEFLLNPADCKQFDNLSKACGREGLIGTYEMLLILHLWERNTEEHDSTCPLKRGKNGKFKPYYPNARNGH